jgi:hypothetical protein
MALSGTTMSEKKIAASTPNRRTGCIVISVIMSGRRQASSISVPSRSARYSGSARPAWRMNHTGVCGTASRRQARRKALSCAGPGVGAGVTAAGAGASAGIGEKPATARDGRPHATSQESHLSQEPHLPGVRGAPAAFCRRAVRRF